MILGLAILGSEFAWAQRLLDLVRAEVARWTRWVRGQGWAVRGLIGLSSVVIVGGVLYLVALWQGVPTWLPDWLVPPLPGL